MLVPLSALWLPMVLAAVAVFIASSLIHMVIGWHNSDYRKLPGEDEILDAMRKAGVSQGDYLFPCAEDPRDNPKSPEILEKWKRGPAGHMTVMPAGGPSMGRNLSLWFIYCLVIGLFAGYVGAATLAPGTEYLRVFQVVGTAAFLGYAGGAWQAAIWWGKAPTAALKDMLDGLLYGLLTAGVFGWLWP